MSGCLVVGQVCSHYPGHLLRGATWCVTVHGCRTPGPSTDLGHQIEWKALALPDAGPNVAQVKPHVGSVSVTEQALATQARVEPPRPEGRERCAVPNEVEKAGGSPHKGRDGSQSPRPL